MTDEAYEKATELRNSLELLTEAHRIMNYPYPELTLQYNREGLMVDFVKLDEKTREALKDAIKSIIDTRQDEIHKEFKAL